MIRRIAAAALALGLCLSLGACGGKNDKGETRQTASAPELQEADQVSESEAPKVDYDTSVGVKLFAELDGKLRGNYTLTRVQGETTFVNAVKEDRAYQSQVVSGMKSYTVLPGDGNVYTVYEATTTCTVDDAESAGIKAADLDLYDLFRWQDKEEVKDTYVDIDEETGFVAEHYVVDSGERVFCFDSDLELRKIYVNNESPYSFEVTSLTEADEGLLEVPDVSAYSQE